MPTPTSDQDMSLRTQRELARARIDFLTNASPVSDRVRAPILASWLRSIGYDVVANKVHPMLVTNPELETHLARTAAPVLISLAAALAGQAVSIVLTDQHGLILTRLTADSALARTLDRAGLAPGSVYAEQYVGTNGIGTALEIGGPVHVVGHEHYAEHLEDLACAATPIHHPLTGRTLGVLDLTCRRKDAGSLLLTLARTTAAQVEAALLDQTRPAARLLVDEYLRACHRSANIVLAVGDEIGMVNDRARSVLAPADQSELLRYAAEALLEGRHAARDIELAEGRSGRVTYDPVRYGTGVVGLVVRVRLQRPSAEVATGAPASIATLPGLVGRAPVWRAACRAAEQAFAAGTWLAVTGEPGSGKLSLLRAIQLRRQPVPRLTVLDCSRSGDPGWSANLHEALSCVSSSLVLRHVDKLPTAGLRVLVGLLQLARDAERPPWVALTLTTAPAGHDLFTLLRLFPATLDVPPLRLHPDDIAPLVKHFLARLGDSSPPCCSPEAMAMLTRAAWPGNGTQLQTVIAQVLTRRRCGVIECSDLPPGTHSLSRRQLSVMEALERDAIVRALDDAHGDRGVAAVALGMSRATIYRRLKAYGIVD